jgi:hypothetical protein
MSWRNPITRFLCRALIIYALLAFPWPGLNKAYGNYFRALCRLVFTADDGHRELSFETPGDNSRRSNDTRVAIVNKQLMHPDGSGPVRNLDVNFGWLSTALLLALILATPVSWPRRRWALLWGLLAIHAFLLLLLKLCIFDESTEISLVNLSPFWKAATSACRDALASQTNLAVPILIWILVTFRREDRLTLPISPTLVAKESRG